MENRAYDHVAVAATVSNRDKGHVDLLALEKLNLSCPPSTHLPMSWAHVCCVHSLVFILFRSEERERERRIPISHTVENGFPSLQPDCGIQRVTASHAPSYAALAEIQIAERRVRHCLSL